MDANCNQCDEEAVLFEDDGTPYCFVHVIEYAKEQLKEKANEGKKSISHLDIVNRAYVKKISLADAEKELLHEKSAETDLSSSTPAKQG
jgi:hypothetical protein